MKTDHLLWRLCGAPLLFAALLVEHAEATDVEGTLRAPQRHSSNAPPERIPVGYYGEQPNGFVEVVSPRFDLSRELAVVLTGPGQSSASGCVYALWGGDLAPRTLVVRVGQDLRILNRDGFSHELYAVEAKDIPPLQTAPGNERVIRLRHAGRWAVRDRLYPHVKGEIHALPDVVACAEVRSDGTFVFTNVSPGEYRLRVFQGAQEVFTQWVQILDGRSMNLGQLSLPAGRASPR